MKLSTISVLFTVLALGACKKQTLDVTDATVPQAPAPVVVQDVDAGVADADVTVDASMDASSDVADAGSDAMVIADAAKPKAKVRGTRFSEEMLQSLAMACMNNCVSETDTAGEIAFCACACGTVVRRIRESHVTLEQIQTEATLKRVAPTKKELDNCVKFGNQVDELEEEEELQERK